MYTVARRSIVAESRKVKKAGAAGHLEDLSRAQVRTTGSRKWNVGRKYPSGASRAVGARCNVVDRESRRSIVMYTVARRSIVAESRKVKNSGAA